MNVSKRTLAIAGSGLSAIFTALTIKSQLDTNIVIFDKARGLGGRLATRRAENGKFDHGAQYFDISTLLDVPEIQTLLDEKIISSNNNSDKFFSPGGMTNIAKFLLKGFDVKKEHKLLSISEIGGEYSLNFENSQSIICDDIILSCPMPQTIEILRNSKIEYDDSEMDTLTKLEYDPCIVIMVKSKNKISEYNKELGNMFTDQDISWVGDNTLKKVSVEENFYTVQCSPEFSFKHFDLEYDKTNDLLKKELTSIFGKGYEILSNHKWRYSIPKNYYSNSESLVIKNNNFIGLCGDIFTNGKFDGAVRSGISIADKYIKNEF